MDDRKATSHPDPECTECARLEAEKVEARADHDYSRVSDCVVLLAQHRKHAHWAGR